MNFTPPFVFTFTPWLRDILSHDLCWIFLFRFFPSLPDVSVQRAVPDFHVFLRNLVEGRRCVYKRVALHCGFSVLYLVILLQNWTCEIQQQNLICFLDFIEVSKNLFSMQLNATDDGQKSPTPGVNEISSFLDSQVKYMPAQCLILGGDYWTVSYIEDYSKSWTDILNSSMLWCSLR